MQQLLPTNLNGDNKAIEGGSIVNKTINKVDLFDKNQLKVGKLNSWKKRTNSKMMAFAKVNLTMKHFSLPKREGIWDEPLMKVDLVNFIPRKYQFMAHLVIYRFVGPQKAKKPVLVVSEGSFKVNFR